MIEFWEVLNPELEVLSEKRKNIKECMIQTSDLETIEEGVQTYQVKEVEEIPSYY